MWLYLKKGTAMGKLQKKCNPYCVLHTPYTAKRQTKEIIRMEYAKGPKKSIDVSNGPTFGHCQAVDKSPYSSIPV